LNAVFMAKPIAGEAGSSMHLHQSVVDVAGHNIFSQADGSASPAFGHFIGGLQAYLPDLMLVFAPFVNSYRRYVVGTQAPINLHWAHDNRTAGRRQPLPGHCGHHGGGVGGPAGAAGADRAGAGQRL
jgi:glutamine synthetase